MKHFSIIFSFLLIPWMAEAQGISEESLPQVETILSNGVEQFGAKSGQVIIMDVNTGRIVATKGGNFTEWHPSQLVRLPNLLAALETGKVSLDESVDTKDGTLKLKDYTLKDHNWHRGGYGKISIRQGFEVSSNIANYKTIRKVWGEDSLAYYSALQGIGYGLPNHCDGFGELPKTIFCKEGLYADITPLQNLAFFNAIANNGKMLQPHTNGDSAVVVKELIASKEKIAMMQEVLRSTVTDGLGRKADSDKVEVAGLGGTTIEEDDSYRLEFCGYFPFDDPQYTILVVLNKEGLPASSGAMAGAIFKEVAHLLTNNHD